MTRTSADPITLRQRLALVVATLALTVVGVVFVFRSFPTEGVAGSAWLRTLECDFRQDWCPAGWGWGSWKLGPDGLVGSAPADSFAVYFFGRPSLRSVAAPNPDPTSIGNSELPCDYFRHGGEFVMETEVRLLQAAPEREAEAQLLIRESNAVNDETGVALVAGRSSAIIRYRAGGIDHILGNWPVAAPIRYGSWHRISFIAKDGQIRAELDGAPVFDSRVDSLSAALRARIDSLDPDTKTLPPGRFIEPHIAVKNGSAEFRNVRLLVRPGDRWAFVR